MGEIIKIVIKSCSGFGPVEEAYTDKLKISADGLKYEYMPYIRSDQHPIRKWSYCTNSPDFGNMWQEVCSLIPTILGQEEIICLDAGELSFAIRYEDGRKAEKKFTSIDNEYVRACLQLIRMMVPQTEKMPEALWLEEDWEDDSEADD